MSNTSLVSGAEATFGDWTGNRELDSLGTNAGAPALAFQHWRNIKEAFAPELIARALDESAIPVGRCIDPFGGSGTTGMACQFLGVHPVVAEVNPYLADLMEAKLTSYSSVDELSHELQCLVDATASVDTPTDVERRFSRLPRTFVEPGRNGRWIFDRPVAERVAALHVAIEALPHESHRRLFRVLLGGILVDVSNVVVSGKGRRYRRRWWKRLVPATRVTEMFHASAQAAIEDIRSFGRRSTMSYELVRGDSRVTLPRVAPCELAVFSPPYPNSFDYTDVYNVELWMLGYLNDKEQNSRLRSATLASHVQISREFPSAPIGSSTLTEVIAKLQSRSDELWDRRIPAMVGAYFSDLLRVLADIRSVLVDQAATWIVVGDSRYAGVQIPVATVLHELCEGRGWRVLTKEPFRSMRTSAQQGGRRDLQEHLLILQKDMI